MVVTETGSRAAEDVLVSRAEALVPLLAGLSPRERSTLERLLWQVTARLATDYPDAVRVCRLCDREACTSGPGCPLDHTTGRRPTGRSRWRARGAGDD